VLYVGDADVDVLGGVGAGVDTILIGHAREPAAEIACRAWRAVTSPFEAYEWILRCTAPVNFYCWRMWRAASFASPLLSTPFR